MKDKKTIIAAASSIAYGNLWLCVFTLHKLEFNDWRAFPLIVTFMAVFIASAAVCINAATKE